MSTEENKAVARRIIEFWNGGDLGVLDEIIAPDYVRHWHGGSTQVWPRVVQAAGDACARCDP